MPTTEILHCPLVAGSEIGNPDNHAAQIMKEVGDTLAQQDGVQQINFGMFVESPDTLQLFVNWDSLSAHQTFMAAAHYQPFLKRFLTIAGGSPSIAHAELKPDGALSKALAAPVTEVATFYFDSAPPGDALDNAQKFAKMVEDGKAQGVLGAAVGITHEEIEREGVKGKGLVIAIGWTSVDAHMKFRETETFKENINLLRNGAKKIEMHHVAFMNFVA
ncbi:hypothetical protein DOTSEDRAFT_66151 [Dothistroma septosporum NZE10]|uniref:ABM domain-containing protein n=1 Tax=Dothistroma septosporum (strain NZE10 / CBS 128990) TaxID=675120 RepID=N1PGB7_DOTSN|nr:hypothetical protein DOTSEDRAFT_66151 [Dothistroma septosporum NZE10]